MQAKSGQAARGQKPHPESSARGCLRKPPPAHRRRTPPPPLSRWEEPPEEVSCGPPCVTPGQTLADQQKKTKTKTKNPGIISISQHATRAWKEGSNSKGGPAKKMGRIHRKNGKDPAQKRSGCMLAQKRRQQQQQQQPKQQNTNY